MARWLAGKEGLLVSVCAGVPMVPALKVAIRLPSYVVVTIFADSGHKSLSERFWDESK
jgi:cysteine synthase